MYLDPQQLTNAIIIIEEALKNGLGSDGAIIGIMTALDESSLYNYANTSIPESLNYPHDKVTDTSNVVLDSLGLFQQRPQWWGTVQEIMTPKITADKFYQALAATNWKNATHPWVAAQAVQQSATADGSNYKAQYKDAVDIVNGLLNGGENVLTSTPTAAGWTSYSIGSDLDQSSRGSGGPASGTTNQGTGGQKVTFSPDSSLVGTVLEEPNHSGPSFKHYIVVHDIECPPGKGWAEALGGPAYLQNPAEQASVHYIVDADSIVQGEPESIWAWGCGTPGSAPGIQIEQAGYASFSRDQWLGNAAAVGSTYQRPDGSYQTYTAQDAADMASQQNLLAKLIADILTRHGWTAAWMSDADVQAVCNNGATVPRNLTYHAQITRSVGGTVHSDPGTNYPFDVLLAKVQSVMGGTTTPSNPTSNPTSGDTTMALTPDVQAAFDKIPAALWGTKNVHIVNNGKTIAIPAGQALELSVNLIGHTRDAVQALSTLVAAQSGAANYVFFTLGGTVYEAYLPNNTVNAIHSPAEYNARRDILTKTGNKFYVWPGVVTAAQAALFGLRTN